MTAEGREAPRERHRPSIDDVAREAGVSKGTVSRVLNGKNWVADTTRTTVLDAVQRTGFVANASARSLATRRTGSIALVLGAPPTKLFEDPNYALILQVITNELAASDVTLMFMTASSPADRDRLAKFLRGGHVDGMVFLSAGEPRDDDLVHLMEEHPIPVIVCGHPFPDRDPLPFVAADEVEGGRLLGAHFRRRGYRRIGVIASHLESIGARLRTDSFLGEVGARSKPAWFIETDDYSFDAGHEAMRVLLDRDERLDAIFAASDVLAAGAVEAIRERGLSVPGDIAVAGFDDSAIARRTSPALTTIRQNVEEVARELVIQLTAAIDGKPSGSRTVPVELIIRESA